MGVVAGIGKLGAAAGVVAALAALAMAGVAVSPAQQGQAQAGGQTAASSGGTAELAELYPEQYASYAQHDYNRSHSNMAADLDTGSEVKFQVFCVSCKSSDYNALYETYGDELYAFDETGMAMTADELTAEEQVTLEEMWDCTTCHADPSGDMTQVGAQISFFNDLGRDFAASLPAGDAVCGQCHNALAAWVVADDFSQATCDPYRYGTDADAMLKAAKEDGAQHWTDAATGIVTYKGNHAIVENFQESTHAAMGLTCVDCHMQETTGEDGGAYTDHNASGQVMYSNVKLGKCLECHQGQDNVSSVTDMFYWLRLKETQLSNAQGEAQKRLGELYDLILNAAENPEGVDAAALEQAKDLYTTADYYIEWASMTYISRNNQTADARGVNAAHGYDGSMNYFARATNLAQQAIDLLG